MKVQFEHNDGRIEAMERRFAIILSKIGRGHFVDPGVKAEKPQRRKYKRRDMQAEN